MKKNFLKGSILFGIIGIALPLIFIIVAFIIFRNLSVSAGWIFFVFFVLVCCAIIGISIVNLNNGLKSNKVKRLGSPSNGVVVERITKHHHSRRSYYTCYYVVFQYNDELGASQTSEELISKKMYESLLEGAILPILVYKERAIINYEKMNSNNN